MQDSLWMMAKLVISGVLGGMVGYEREVHEHPAGLRTHILVCMGATLITLVSMSFASGTNDPGRIAAQIVSGIGFLGAGTILRQGNIVRGLTTAASLWTVAGIGMAVGVGGQYLLIALVGTLIVFTTLSILRGFEPPVARKLGHQVYLEMSEHRSDVLAEVIRELSAKGVAIQSIKGTEPPDAGKQGFKLHVRLPRRFHAEQAMQLLAGQEGLDHFEWT